MAIRNELTEEQITNLMQSIPRAEEVDRLRAEIKRLRADLATQQGCCDGAAAQDAHVRREREEHRAEVDRLRAEIEKLRAENERLREVIRTIRARCVELDDSDAVSETLDIATAVLEDEP